MEKICIDAMLSTVNAHKCAEEVKSYIYAEKFNHIDYGYSKIEMYPSPQDKSNPELYNFSQQWEDVFDWADKIVLEDGSNFPNEEVSKLETKAKEIEKIVNDDIVFWTKLRDEVIPIYERSKEYETVWKNRWKSIRFWYDPVGINVKTTKKIINKCTGQQIGESEVINSKELPPGFVISIQ